MLLLAQKPLHATSSDVYTKSQKHGHFLWKQAKLYGKESHLCSDFEETDASTHRIQLICKDFLRTPSKGIVFSSNTGFGQGVKKCGLADVGQAHDAAFEAHGFSLNINALSSTTQPWRKCPIRIEAYSVFWGRRDVDALFLQSFFQFFHENLCRL